ncbi:hypothetical protein HMPREF0591_4823 [Mycobacterium parascrofulaceum ATCC BAA-614]|uniref:Uncharacterized protein n=1 Tax=Mycobacterium parascrofulaceum ATCC BAA-614 TaxID=525368 RepID=D5PF79_9MYCO|nr:hypothetical protein HMPREF0591_4823 [Mycobacterium parascrofulaceum ATCC BAA-614]
MPTRSPNTKEIPRMREFFTGMAFTAGVLGAYLGAVGILVKTFSWLADYPIW